MHPHAWPWVLLKACVRQCSSQRKNQLPGVAKDVTASTWFKQNINPLQPLATNRLARRTLPPAHSFVASSSTAQSLFCNHTLATHLSPIAPDACRPSTNQCPEHPSKTMATGCCAKPPLPPRQHCHKRVVPVTLELSHRLHRMAASSNGLPIESCWTNARSCVMPVRAPTCALSRIRRSGRPRRT